MCAAHKVQVLSMDGLGAARDCKHSTPVPLFGVTLCNTLGGSIPVCLWSLPLLQVPQLTANGLTGSLSGTIAGNSTLKTLSIGM
jgi:hypothetical protein